MDCNIILLLMENTLMKKIVHLAILMYAKSKQTNQSWLRTPGAVIVWRGHPEMNGMIYRQHTLQSSWLMILPPLEVFPKKKKKCVDEHIELVEALQSCTC